MSEECYLRSRTIPIFSWPLDFGAKLLSFVFLYNTGTSELSSGFGTSETRAFKVKTLLTAYTIVSLFEIVPSFAFDTALHFGALCSFVLPVLLFVTPDKKNPKETIGVWIADSVFAQISSVIGSVIPDAFTVSRFFFDQQDGSKSRDRIRLPLSCRLVYLVYYCKHAVWREGRLTESRWSGFLGSSGSYLAVYFFLFLQTTNHLGKDFISPTESSSGWTSQMTIWHNLLAIWLWRYLISAIETVQIPGIISVKGWILYHLPSYYLWTTALFFVMLLTKKTASGGVSLVSSR